MIIYEKRRICNNIKDHLFEYVGDLQKKQDILKQHPELKGFPIFQCVNCKGICN